MVKEGAVLFSFCLVLTHGEKKKKRTIVGSVRIRDPVIVTVNREHDHMVTIPKNRMEYLLLLLATPS